VSSAQKLLADQLAGSLGKANVTTLSRAVLKRDRSLPVASHFAGALRAAGLAGGLPRGSVCAVTGAAPVALAALLLAEANASGAWVAWCATTTPNTRALFDAGWQLDRVVCIDPRRDWVACMNACIGEFELVVTQIPSSVAPADVRRMATAVSRTNGVVVVVDEPRRSVSVDLEFRVEHCNWAGVDGGHLSAQDMRVVLAGRRVPDPHPFRVVYGPP
jgi:threonine dehydrogenase-like Zn-dependent dehydrogenase